LDWAPSISDFPVETSNVSRTPSGCTYVTFGIPSGLSSLTATACRHSDYGIPYTVVGQAAMRRNPVVLSVELHAVSGQVFHETAARLHDVVGHVLARSLVLLGAHRSQDARVIGVGVRVPLGNLLEEVAGQVH
jgi:hypothetical protein